jgi:hypothetical protein
MNRRSFLQKSLIIPGLGAGVLLGGAPRRLFAGTSATAPFSLSIVSDKPQQAITMIQEWLSRNYPGQKNINYSEYILNGSHVADIVFTRSGRLVDFYRTDTPESATLRRVAKQLGLPHSCDNPVLSHFSIEEGLQQPKGFRVFKDNTLIMEKTFPQKTETFVLDGVKGRMVIEAAADRSLRFVEASCTHKTCMSMGHISQAGQNLVCVPNQITVAIAGRPVSGVDSITF